MPLWDTVMIALVIGSTILFCIWARIRATDAMAKSISATSLKVKNPNAPELQRQSHDDC
jgi:hypothetical protein